MIRYFCDTETNGFGSPLLISIAIARDEKDVLYLVIPEDDLALMRPIMDPWVSKNIVPILFDVPQGVVPTIAPIEEWGHLLSEFIYRGDEVPQVFADWTRDISHVLDLFNTDEKHCVPMGHQTHFVVLRHIDVYPTTLEGAVRHNAAWDALALKRWLDEMEAK